ncbi:MAG: alpha/beta hydrolase [Bacteroidaceae bacterium]|nr:alpha/beta hydrolase [Bacteroidaceae bacterium]
MKRLISVLCSVVAAVSVMSQNVGDEGPTLTPNRIGLVYEDAISENVAGRVNIHRVNYQVEGIGVVANVYTPAGYDPKKSYAAVVVAHPNGGSKDQVAGLYAQRLSEAGFVTIAFDARYQGESGGEPRRTDKPANRIGDIMGAIDFIQQYPGVDKDRIGAFGICGGGGYTFATAQVDKRIKAVGTLSLFNTGDVRRNGYMRTQMNTVKERQREASLARQKEAAGAEPEMAGFMNWTPEEARQIKVDLYRDGYFYYGVTHKSPNAPGTYLKSSLMDMMAWDATDHADLVDQPLLIIAGEKADSRYMSEEAFAKASGTADKELFIVPGATHIRTYFVPEYVEQIAAKIQQFFTLKL